MKTSTKTITSTNLTTKPGCATGRPTTQRARAAAASGRKNNVFADRNGNVHRRTDQGWESRANQGWRQEGGARGEQPADPATQPEAVSNHATSSDPTGASTKLAPATHGWSIDIPAAQPQPSSASTRRAAELELQSIEERWRPRGWKTALRQLRVHNRQQRNLQPTPLFDRFFCSFMSCRCEKHDNAALGLSPLGTPLGPKQFERQITIGEHGENNTYMRDK